ncbi:acetyl-CoA C-acyltransferase [Nitrosomonas sp. JL21]|uniref:acetyl-CoA C-acyltransferase family protein n=1 Tax=Nitrosomonas sp. JL21 TaxID=153949 RepID=UPI00136A8641|nr:acetyl-CoA C-acyltransferase family protein [Nitrosomonas sp. JL21]MBL8497299.1 acetyl-CoA C-acyltransferase family protein [Nitrosomonas sp.]MCC7092194.1 acetyl-CoA C-acyltransferase family protein [Nitrosomonas sp.]MXS77168.1 acetyl-CoA C-acyltransferase [Nitrosomonas sp. JL21]
MKEVVILSGVRTAIGDYGGALKQIAAAELAASVVREAIARASIDPEETGHLVFGNVIHGEPRDMYLARVASINGGLPQHTAALTVNRLCGSGLQAIVSASQHILLGDTDVAVAGGAESMSRAGYLLPALRWGQRMNDGNTVDMMVGALTDPFDHVHMGMTAENIAAKWHIGRQEQDEYAAESHRRALHAIQNGYFKEQILPIEIIAGKKKVSFDTDEHPRVDTSAESLAALRPVFKKDGTVTAGNASGINDSAAALVLMDGSAAEKRNLTPLARLVAYGHAGVDPKLMGIGPIPAVQQALHRAGLTVADLDVVESNEAFAVQACAVAKELQFDPTKTNPNGGAVALGHPIGATGSILTIKAIYELHRCKGRYALVTMCIGGGQGIAAVFERL